jgi:malonyl-CoA O-methyltransferase
MSALFASIKRSDKLTAVKVDTEQTFIRQVAQSFGNASDSYLAAARLQQQVALDALSSLPPDKQGHLLDLGCGPGWIHPRLTQYCNSFSAVDLSAGMLNKAAALALAKHYLQADAALLPVATASIDKLFSSLMLQWCPKPERVLSEIARVLAPDGRMVLTTLVDGTLTELTQAFASIDDKQHVNQFLPAAKVIAAAQAIANMQWQFELRNYPLYYPDVQSLARELKALGANQVAGRQSRGLTGKAYWRQLAGAYEARRTVLGLPASYQVLRISGVKHGI